MEMIYQPAKPLWPTQEEALSEMQGKEAFALFMAMRTGKSATILADFGRLELNGKAQDICIIAPAGVYRTWLTEMEEHLSHDLKERLKVHVWQSGYKAEEKIEKFLAAPLNRPRCLLMNVEALSVSKEARQGLEKFLSRRVSYLAIDESTIIKNHKAKRTKYINRVARPLAHYRRILSGLPTPRSPLDLYSQFEFLDWRILGFTTYAVFQRAFAIEELQRFGGRLVKIVVGFRKGTEDYLAKLIEPHSYRVQFRPKVPSTYSIREVELTDVQKKAYEEMKRFATTQLENTAHVTASVVIAQIIRMHQILCGHVRDEEGNNHELPEKRSAALLNELEEYAGKAIVWFTYVQDLEKCRAKLEKEYGEGSTAAFYGDNFNVREKEEERFRNDPACRFMLATAGAGGRGRKWSVADRVIYFSNSDNLEHREQSEQRSQGVDKEQGVDYVDLVVPGTVDMKILKALRAKINMASAINGDNYREWLI